MVIGENAEPPRAAWRCEAMGVPEPFLNERFFRALALDLGDHPPWNIVTYMYISMYIYIYVCISIYLSIYLTIYLSIYLSLFMSW